MATLQQQEFETLVADANGVIGLLEHEGPVNRTLEALRGKSWNVFIPKCVLKEIKKVRGYSELEIIQSISRKLHKKVSVLKFNEDIQAYADILETKHPLAHFPDSLLLACGKICAFTILTYDRGMICVAKSEGISTLCPKGGFQN